MTSIDSSDRTMTAVTTTHIVLDERGVAYIEGKRFKVVVLVMDMMNGMAPGEMQQSHPQLTLAEVHAALAYYYDHQEAIDKQIQASVEFADRMYAEAVAKGTQPTLADLKARLAAKQAQ